MTVYILIGFLGSGKSMWAKKFAKENPNTKIVCPDSFREMLNGEYQYIEELDDVITQSVFDTATNLLNAGYDVIIDCGNLTNDPDRRGKWKKLRYDIRNPTTSTFLDNEPSCPCKALPYFVAVVFPQKNIDWHVNNRLKKPHWKGADWKKIAEGERRAFESINLEDFDEVIKVKEF